MSYLKYELEFSYSILQGEAVFKIFETADNYLMMWILITETYPQTLLVCQWYVYRPQHPAARSTGWANNVITAWWPRASWSRFCVLVLIFVCLCDFRCLGDILLPWVILFGYAVTWCLTSSLYGGHVNLGMIFSPSWMKFSSWCEFVCLGVILHLGTINQILVWFSFVLDTIIVLVRFYFFWCR